MSIRIIKHGIQDVFYDSGRFGHQHIGINPGGVMDHFAMQVANALALNHPNEAVLEMHFPAAEILFETDALIAIAGADFSPGINQGTITNHQPIMVKAGAVLKFNKPVQGARAYLAVHDGFQLTKWLGSYSTNLLCKTGGHNGKALFTNDVVGLKSPHFQLKRNEGFKTLPFAANVKEAYKDGSIRLMAGRHYDELTEESKRSFENNEFEITGDSNRMGYRLQSGPMFCKEERSLLSTAVTMGTIQLLPNGQLIMLMADHQTIGGYPMIAHVVSADLPGLAQHVPGKKIRFSMISLHDAQQAFVNQQQHIRFIQNACNLRMNQYLVHV